MKRYRNFFVVGVLVAMMGMIYACKEDNTFEGSDQVYIEITPRNPILMVGDTLAMNASVTNISGDTIRDAEISWSVADEDVARVIEGNHLVAIQGAQGKTTNVYARLSKGDKYAVARLTVTNHAVDGIAPVLETIYSYGKAEEIAWFTVKPKNLLMDYKPTFINSNPELVIPADEPFLIEADSARIGFVFSSTKTFGTSDLTVSIGPAGGEKTATVKVVVSPSIVSTFGEDFNLITYEMSKTMDVNSQDTIWVNTKVLPAYPEDLVVAEKNYVWEPDGNAAQMVKKGNIVVPDRGHKAYVVLKSADFEGESTIRFSCQGYILNAAVSVQNYDVRYPVDKLSVNKESLTIPMEGTAAITPAVEPVSSYGFHQPQFKVEDETIAEVVGYTGSEMFIRGLQIGKTKLIVTSLDKTIEVPVEVTEKVTQIVWGDGIITGMFVGQTNPWSAAVKTASGKTYPVEWVAEPDTLVKFSSLNDDASKASVEAIYPGKVVIRATSGGKFTDPKTVTIMDVPEGIQVSADKANLDGCYVGVEGDNVVIYYTANSEEEGYGSLTFTVHNAGVTDNVSGDYNVADLKTTMSVKDAVVTLTSGSINISKDIEGLRTVTMKDVVCKIGDKQFAVTGSFKSY